MMRKPTLLLIGNYFISNNKNQNIWHEFAEKLSNSGWKVTTISNQNSRVLRLLDMLWSIIRFRKEYSLAQVDVFSGMAFIWAELSTYLLKTIGKPIIQTLHGGALPEFAARHPRRVKRVLKAANLVVSPSPYLVITLSPYLSNIHHIPNPIELSRYPFRLREHPSPRLIWVRSFHEIYNPSLAPKMLAYLINDFPEIQLVMIGPDEGDGSLQRMQSIANDLGVQDRVQLIGAVPPSVIPKWLNKADIFINTTNYDNAPRSVIEAMASGLCIVTTNIGGIPYLVSNEIEAILVPPDDAPAMASAVKRILSEPALGIELSKNARKKSECFSWDEILPIWESLFVNTHKDHYG